MSTLLGSSGVPRGVMNTRPVSTHSPPSTHPCAESSRPRSEENRVEEISADLARSETPELSMRIHDWKDCAVGDMELG